MKKIILGILLIVISFGAFAQNKGVNFENISLKEAQKKAKRENKLLFVNISTSWCGYCQMMKKQVFPEENVEKYFNDNFINVVFDAEKGEGINVAKRYEVRGYPTFLILDSDGKLKGTIVGARSADKIIEDAEEIKRGK